MLTQHLFIMSSFTLVLFAMAYTYSGVGYVNRVEGLILVVAFVWYHYYVISNDLQMPQG